MKYKCLTDYKGKIASGDTVEILAGATFDVIGEYIAFDNQAICRVNSEFAKQYFEPVVNDPIAKLALMSKSLAVATLSEPPPAITILEVGECPLSGLPSTDSDSDTWATDTILVNSIAEEAEF